MRKFFVIGWLVLLAGIALADCPIKMASEKLGVFLKSPLDSAGIDVEVPDSVWVQVWADNGTATRYEARSTTAPFSDIGLDTSLALFAGLTNLKYVYNPLISDIDGTAGNFQLSGAVTLFTKKIPTTTSFCVQVVADSLSKTVSLVSAYLNATISSRSTFSASTDSVKPSGTVLASLNNIIKTNSFGAGAIDDNAVADGAIDFGGEFDSTGISQIIRIVFGDSLATFVDSAALARAVWDNDVVGQSLRTIIVAGMNSGVIDSVDFASTAISFLKTVFLDYVNGTLDASEIGADAIGSSEFAGTAVAEAADAFWDEVIGGAHEISGSAGKLLLDANAFTFDLYTNGVKLKVFGLDADSSFTNLQAAVAALSGGGGGADTAAILIMLLNNGFFQVPYDSFTVTAQGTNTRRQFVTDRLSKTSAGYYTERLILWSKLGGAAVKRWSSLTNFVNNGSSDTVTVADSTVVAIAAGDQGRIFALPWPNFATLSEASDSGAAAILDADTSNHIDDGTVGQSIARGGADVTDTTRLDQYLRNNEYEKSKDSSNAIFTKGAAGSLPRLGELATLNDSVFTKGGAIDSVRTAVFGSGGSCTGDGAIPFTLYFVDTLGTDELVGDGHIALYTNSSCTGDPAYWGKTGAAGFIPFAVDTGTYWACASKMASVTATSAQYFHVTAAVSDSVLAYGFATSTRAAVVGLVQMSGGPDTVCAYCPVTFEMVTAGGNVRDTVLNTIVIPSPLVGFTDGSGTPVSAAGVPFELRKTQNLVSTVGQQKYPVKWQMKVTLTNGSIWQSPQFSILNATDVVDVGDL